MCSKITDKINSIWNTNNGRGEKHIDNIDTNKFIDDYNNIIVKINEFILEFDDIVDVTRFEKCYDMFIYNIFNLDKSRYIPVYNSKKLAWLQITTCIGRGLFIKNDTNLASCTNDFIIYVIKYFEQLKNIRKYIEEFKKKYNSNIDQYYNNLVEIQNKEEFKHNMLSTFDTYLQYNKSNKFNKRIAIVNESFNSNDIEFYTLKDDKYYQIRIKTDKAIKYTSDLNDDQIEYIYKICIYDNKDEIKDIHNNSKLCGRITKLIEEDK